MGIHEPRAQPKRAVVGARPRSAVEMAAQGQRCPLKGDPMSDAPSGWRYDPTLWAPLIDMYLAPWAAGNLSATVLDMAYWPQMYGTTRAHALPGVHAAVKDGYLFVRSQNDYRLELFLDMMKTVSGLVRLPNAEFVACLYDHAKVDRQTPLPVFVHYSDVAHRDVPIPAPWSWDETQHAFPQPWVKVRAGCATPWSQRDSVLYFRGGCNGPTRGWRGPLWKFYPRKRANQLSAAHTGQIDAGVYDHCDSPKLSKIEWGWDAAMEREMSARAPKKPIDKFAANCAHKHLLHIDGNAASSRLASELHVGSTIFKQDSFSNEYFYPLLRPYVHYVPVAASLHDVPEKLAWAKAHPQQAEAIANAGKQFAREHLHVTAVACYWWQLLTAFAELQNFEPRTHQELGFRQIS